MARRDAALDVYEKRAGLPPLADQSETEAFRLLNLPSEQLRRMNADECGEAAVELSRFGLHLQRVLNRELARVRWVEENVRAVVASQLSKVPGYSFDERKLHAVRQNPQAVELDKVRVEAQLRVERVSYLAGKVETLARCFLELQQTRRRHVH